MEDILTIQPAFYRAGKRRPWKWSTYSLSSLHSVGLAKDNLEMKDILTTYPAFCTAGKRGLWKWRTN